MSNAWQPSDEAIESAVLALTSGDDADWLGNLPLYTLVRTVLVAAHGVESPKRDQARTEYGHVLPDGTWLPELRGINYASHQRVVHFSLEDPVVIDHWSYTDHRHPIDGCKHDRHDLTVEAALAARGSTAAPERGPMSTKSVRL